MTLTELIKKEYSQGIPMCHFLPYTKKFWKKAREVEKICKDVALGWNYHRYGENPEKGAIGKSNVESWTWQKPRVIYG